MHSVCRISNRYNSSKNNKIESNQKINICKQ